MAGSAGADLISTIGHGALGLRDNLKTFSAFMEDSVSRKDVTVECRPGEVVKQWSPAGSGAYVAPLDFTRGGVRLDVVSVRTASDPELVRVETLAVCQATPGSYFYDPDQVFSSPQLVFDTGAFDSGLYWDQFAELYVHLSDGSDPTLTTVVANFGLYFASRAMIQPNLGPTLLVDGDFENWTNPTTPSSWSIGAVGDAVSFQWDNTAWDSGLRFDQTLATAIAQDTATVYKNASALRLSLSNASPGAAAQVYQAVSGLVAGKRYRLSVYYLTPAASPAGVSAALRVTDVTGANDLYRDGRSTAGSGVALTTTGGEWRRATFDFVAPSSSVRVYVALLNQSGGVASGQAWFDVVSLQRIFRFNYYEPRVLPQSIPALSTGSKDVFFGGKQIGQATIQLINTDGGLERDAGAWDWLNHDVLVNAGAEFKDGQEILYDEWRQQFTGRVQQLTCDDHLLSLNSQDIRVFFHIQLPDLTYNDQSLPNMDPGSIGKPIPIWFGQKANITPVRIDLEATWGKYGVYQLADMSRAPAGLFSVDRVFAYTSSQMARDKRTDQRLTLVAGVSYSVNLNAAKITLLEDVGPYVIDTTNNLLDFDIGGGALLATLTPGLYTSSGLAAHIATVMSNAAAVSINCAYSNATSIFTISKPSGTLNLRNQSGAHASAGPWAKVGFNRSTDRTGALSYAGDNATFQDNEKNFFLRVDGKGYADTSSGKYTGTPGALITVAADICQMLFERFLKKPYWLVDQASFSNARNLAPQACTIYLTAQTSTQTVFDSLEYSNAANIIIDGSGAIYYYVYDGSIPASTPTLYDRDFIGFQTDVAVIDVYQTVIVQHDQDPSTGQYITRQASDPSVVPRFGRTEPRTLATWLKSSDTAQVLANRLLTLAQRPARKIHVITKGKLFDREVGTKVKLIRQRATDANGALSGQAFRILNITKNPQGARVEADLIDDFVTVANLACITACQRLCELAAQGCAASTCESSCQGGTCQKNCETSLQGCGFTICQTACEGGTTQGGGGGGCTTGCQTTCQTTCQRSCQQCGQSTGPCQSSCETACQACGQAGHCQEACEANCQTGCEVTCQGWCQRICQVPTREA